MGAREWIAPGGRAVPQILDGRIVVQADAVDEVVTVDRGNVGKTNIRVVDAEAAALIVIGQLNEGADIVRDMPGIEQAELLRKVGGGLARSGIVRFGGKTGRGHDHRGDGRKIAQRQGRMLLLIDILDFAGVEERIAAHLEDAPEWRELRKHGVAGLTGEAGLSRKARHGESRLRRRKRCERQYSERK